MPTLFESSSGALIRYQLGSCGERCEIYEPIIIIRPQMVHLADDVRLDGLGKIEGGEGVHIDRFCHVASLAHLNIGGGRLHLAEGSAVASGAKIVTGSSHMSGLSMSAKAPKDHQVIVRGFVEVGKNAVILTNAVILPNVTIGEGAVVAAGAVVRRDVEPWTIVAGVPAKVIGHRDIAHVCTAVGELARSS